MSYHDGPGQPGEPWERAARDPFADPYGEPGGYAPDAPPEPPPPPAGKGSTVLLVLLVSVLVLVLCGGGVAVLYLIGAKDRTPTANGPTPPPASKGTSPSASPTRSDDPNAILKGQCVVNVGSKDEPVLHVVKCGPDTYEVLARYDGTTDDSKCKSVPGSDFHYFYDTSPDTLDFVLCLKSH